jgi:prophage maintenance system killer protein
VDGNKRTGTTSAAYLLSTFGYEVGAEQQELEDFAVNVAEGTVETAEIALWFAGHSFRT